MLEELELKINIYLKKKVKLIHRADVNVSLLPHVWKGLSNSPTSLKEMIRQIWQIESEATNEIISLLIENVDEILFVMGEDSDIPIAVCYLYKNPKMQGKNSCWLAYPPINVGDFINACPSSYRKFLSVHNGFLLDGNSAIGFLPLERLNFVQDDLSNNKNLLAFCGDGLGNNQCFDLSEKINTKEIITVDWDHETKELTNKQEFWSFAYGFIKKTMGL